MPGLCGEVGFDYGAIRLALEANIPKGLWGWYFDRCCDVIGVIKKAREKG